MKKFWTKLIAKIFRLGTVRTVSFSLSRKNANYLGTVLSTISEKETLTVDALDASIFIKIKPDKKGDSVAPLLKEKQK